jgi:hypothetical protein
MGTTWRDRRNLACSTALAALVLALGVGGGAAAAATTTVPNTVAPAATAPSAPDGTGASVVLRCGSDTTTRLVASFDAPVEAGQQASLYFQTPQSGGFLTTQVAVGDEVPNPPDLVWAIDGVQLGPWPVGSVDDTCASGAQLAATGATHALLLALVATSVVGAGVLLVGLRTRRRPA